MKRSLRTILIAAPLLMLSSMACAAEAAPQEAMLLSSAQMDGVTAGTAAHNGGLWRPFSLFSNSGTFVNQINISPVIIVQIGNNNYANVISGNFASIYQ
jgi:hypothetical protein